MIKYLFILLHCTLLLSSYGNALQVRYLNVEQGLSSRQTISTVQDKYQFIWISTKIGIDRYDGNQIKHYTLPLGDYECPLENYYLKIDNDSDVWAYNDIGQIFKYNYAIDSFELKYNLYNNQFASSLWVHDLYFGTNNRIWIATLTGLFYIQDGILNEMARNPLFHKNIVSVQSFDNQSILVATQHELFTLKEKDLSFNVVLHSMGNGAVLQSIFWDRTTKKIWIGTFANGLKVYDFSKNEFLSLNKTLSCLPKVPCCPMQSSTHPMEGALKYACSPLNGTGVWR